MCVKRRGSCIVDGFYHRAIGMDRKIQPIRRGAIYDIPSPVPPVRKGPPVSPFLIAITQKFSPIVIVNSLSRYIIPAG
jgi:hypothetical protein